MRIHYLQHSEYDNTGMIESWAHGNKYLFTGTRIDKQESLPELSEFDFLIVMGGDQYLQQISNWPYFQNEINFIQQAITANKMILGICLGAQLIAESMGVKTQKSPYTEIGVYPVTLLPDGLSDPIFSQFEKEFLAMHMHHDMVGLPANSQLLAKSAGCPNQAFKVGDNVYALQFHLEMTSENIRKRLAATKNELNTGEYVASRNELERFAPVEMNKKMILLLDGLCQKFRG